MIWRSGGFVRTTLRAIVVGVFFAAPAYAQTPAAVQAPRPPQTYAAFLQGQYATLKRNLVGSAEKMPAEHFAFKPVPEVMSYAGLLGHVANTQFIFCHAVKGGTNPADGQAIDKLTDKAALIRAVNDAFAYCDDVFAPLTDASAVAIVALGTAPNQWQAARASQLSMVIIHGNEHYGNLVTYMRSKGIVPPSSSPQ